MHPYVRSVGMRWKMYKSKPLFGGQGAQRMEIRKMKNKITVEGTRIYKGEIIIINSGMITVIPIDDMPGDSFKSSDKKLSKIIENSTEIVIA